MPPCAKPVSLQNGNKFGRIAKSDLKDTLHIFELSEEPQPGHKHKKLYVSDHAAVQIRTSADNKEDQKVRVLRRPTRGFASPRPWHHGSRAL